MRENILHDPFLDQFITRSELAACTSKPNGAVSTKAVSMTSGLGTDRSRIVTAIRSWS
jgi:hypothetical protein